MNEEHYTTPQGVDERIVQLPAGDLKDALEKAGAHLQNWNGFKILAGGHAGQYGAMYLDLVQTKRTNEESLIIIISGKPGSGKTYHAIRFAEILDPKFDPDLQIVFTRQQFLYLVSDDSPLVRGQCIIFDESHFGMGARNWYNQIQKMLMDNIVALRSKGLIIIIVALHLEQLDKVIRQYVLSFMHHMEGRGLATLYELYTQRFNPEVRKKRLGQMELRLPGVEGCGYKSCLSCQWSGVVQKDWRRRDKWEEEGYRGCNSVRAKYERNKKQFISDETEKAKAVIRAQELRDNPLSHDEYAEMIMDSPDTLYFTSQRNPHNVSIMTILKELGYPIKSTIASHVQKVLINKYEDEMDQLYEIWKTKKDAKNS